MTHDKAGDDRQYQRDNDGYPVVEGRSGIEDSLLFTQTLGAAKTHGGPFGTFYADGLPTLVTSQTCFHMGMIGTVHGLICCYSRNVVFVVTHRNLSISVR